MLFPLCLSLVSPYTKEKPGIAALKSGRHSSHHIKTVSQVLSRAVDQLSMQHVLHFILINQDFPCLSVAMKFSFCSQIEIPSKDKKNNCMRWGEVELAEIPVCSWKTAVISQFRLDYIKRTKLVAVQEMKHGPGPGRYVSTDHF